MSNKSTLIYIAGYGQSGSTILEGFLSIYTGSFSMGELSNFFSEIENPSAVCGCGERVINCPFWQNVYSNFRQVIHWPLKECNRIQRHVENFLAPLSASKQDYERYEKLTSSLFQAIKAQTETSGKPLIDSSKTAYLCANRPVNLIKFSRINSKVIHLVRDLRAVLWSMHRGRNRSLEGRLNIGNSFFRLRAWLGWVTANHYAARIKRIVGEKNFILIRYEDFVNNPIDTLARIAVQFNLHMNRSIAFEDVSLGEKVHQISGNRARLSTLSIRPDYEWKLGMNQIEKRLIYAAAWPLMSAYRYKT
jgi:hypothetical protein